MEEDEDEKLQRMLTSGLLPCPAERGNDVVQGLGNFGENVKMLPVPGAPQLWCGLGSSEGNFLVVLVYGPLVKALKMVSVLQL